MEKDPKSAVPSDPDAAPFVPASPTRRVAAWVGLAYMIILVLLNLYALSTGDTLHGIGFLMVCPALVGFGVHTLLRYRAGRVKLAYAIGMIALCVAGFVWGLMAGIPALLGQLGGAA